MAVRRHPRHPLSSGIPDSGSPWPNVGAFIAWIRREHGFSQAELSTIVGRSVASVASYEQGLRRPPRPLLLDLLDAMPVDGVNFNDVATWYEYRPITTIDPAAHRSVHEYVTAVRVFFGYTRAGFAATVGCTASAVRAYEHRVKPDGDVLRTLVRRHTTPWVRYQDVAAQFRTLRPTLRDRRLRDMFATLRNLQPGLAEHEALRNQLIVEHLDLARMLARRYQHYRVTCDDAEQVACEALIRAVDRCDPKYGDFIPYLGKWIAGSIRAHARSLSLSGTLRTPLGRTAVTTARDALTQELARDPTNTELAARLGVPASTLEKSLQAWRASTPISINIPHQRDTQPIQAILPAPSQSESFEIESADLVHELLGPLRPEQRRLIELRYLHDADVHEIARRVGFPPDEVETRLAEALEHLRRQAHDVHDAWPHMVEPHGGAAGPARRTAPA
ncbi:sigma-70 family RNA polymerase sigma factor [Micromonospora sp. WMMA1363]|uniref:sigma-70 family RNA polymerase sigma factor n=1 Tax=Micromonospora sp. WMMA1363 TaxID=3053985 RepID=UPI00259CB3D7|nr:sigma-70 family RNA polymerase sigma factor [Micromonospora sp. WMMA1363]MDM4719028.1 sigma-70 family RNA polymerase sigma factor [Micromonospora sp. WMMA1363]